MKQNSSSRLILAILATLLGAAGMRGNVVQADMSALARANSALVGLNKTNGALQRSTDDGATFTTTRVAGVTALYTLAAAADVVIAVGDGGLVVRSTNGGQLWAEATSPAFTGELRDVAIGGSLWVAVGRKNLDVTSVWSSDSGATWTAATSIPVTGRTLRGVTFDASATRWTAVGTDGFGGARILTSTDGKTWTSVTPPVGAPPLNDVAADGLGRVVAVGDAGALLVSTNGGLTFTTDVNSGLVSENLNVVVYSSTAGWVAGGADAVVVGYTTVGGAVVTQAPVPGGGDILTLTVGTTGTVISGGAKASQTINFSPGGSRAFTFAGIALQATASSGLAVTYSVVSGPATVSGSTLTLTGTGTVTIRATQAGNPNYHPATATDRSIVVTSSFDSWRLANFTTQERADANISGATAVRGADGLSNLLRYALGLSLNESSAAALPVSSADTTDFLFTYSRPTAANDVTYAVEASTDLTTWTTTGVTHEFVRTANGADTWRARYAQSGSASVFFRLRVTR